jgi:methyl-accepting chemotaxis protein
VELSRKDIVEVGQAVETLGRLAEQQFESIQQKLNHLSQYWQESLSQLEKMRKQLTNLTGDLQEILDNTDELVAFKQQADGILRRLEKIAVDLENLRPLSEEG